LKTLLHETRINVRFSEVDPMGIVWHGNYLRYIEDGRENFGREHGIGYMDLYEQGLKVPIVKLNINHKKSLRYGDEVLVETTYIDSPAAKIIFKFKLTNTATNEVVATCESTQVFVDEKDELQLNIPDFFNAWRRKVGFIE